MGFDSNLQLFFLTLSLGRPEAEQKSLCGLHPLCQFQWGFFLKILNFIESFFFLTFIWLAGSLAVVYP